MKPIKILLLLFLFVSCSEKESKQTDIDLFLTYPVEFAKKEVKEPNGNYSISVPKDWEVGFETEIYNDSELLIFQAVSVVDEKGGFSGITIFETKLITDEAKDLKSQYEFALKKYKTSGYKLIKSGTTDIFGKQAYYIQAEGGNAELFDFFVESKKENIFFMINISTTQDENLPHNMSVMLNSLKTFKITQN